MSTFDEIQSIYGIDPSSIQNSSYYINEESGMLVISSRSMVAFEGEVKPAYTASGSFSDSCFYYFRKLEDKK